MSIAKSKFKLILAKRMTMRSKDFSVLTRENRKKNVV